MYHNYTKLIFYLDDIFTILSTIKLSKGINMVLVLVYFYLNLDKNTQLFPALLGLKLVLIKHQLNIL